MSKILFKNLFYFICIILVILFIFFDALETMIVGYETPYGWTQECIQYDKNETMYNIYIDNGTNQIYLKTENIDYFNNYCIEYIPTGIQFCNITGIGELIECTEQHYYKLELKYCNDPNIKEVKLQAVPIEPICVKWGLVRYE